MKDLLLKALKILMPTIIKMALQDEACQPENLRDWIAGGVHWLRKYFASTDNDIDDVVGGAFLDLICETFNIPI